MNVQKSRQETAGEERIQIPPPRAEDSKGKKVPLKNR